MENWLEEIRRKTKNESLRTIATIVIVFLAMAGLVALISDLGFGNEITQHRIKIWSGLVASSIIIVLGYKVIRQSSQIVVYANEVNNLESKLTEAQQKEQSLLRLMESYKNSSYNEILDHLKRLTLLVENREKWQDADARVKRIRLNDKANAGEFDQGIAMWNLVEIIINIGKLHNVIEGMEFLVRDENIPTVYGAIAVKEVFDEGATCVFVEEPSCQFWAEAFERLEENRERIILIQDNCLRPNLPEAFDNITPELAKEFQIVVERIAYNGQIGVLNE